MAQVSGEPPRPRLDVIRDDVRAMRAYAVPDATGLIKLDAMENPFSLPPELARELGERLSQVALNRYPQAVHWKTAWLSRDRRSTCPHAEHRWLV